MKHLLRLMRALDDHWMGDLIGCVALFAAGYCALLLGYGAGLK